MTNGLLEGLAGIKQYDEELQRRREEAAAGRVRYVQLKDGQKLTVQPAQELNPDSPLYDAEKGLGIVAVEHQSPSDFRLSAICTNDLEGRCVGCEQHREQNRTNPDYKGAWKPRQNLYLNVIVKDDKDEDGKAVEPYVAVLRRARGLKATIAPVFIDWATDEESITDTDFTIKRTGEGQTGTTYSTTPRPAKNRLDPAEFELYNLREQVIKHVPYEEQAAFYKVVEPESVASEEGAPADDDW